MALRPIVLYPDPVLHEVSAPIVTVDADVRRLLDDLAETMYDSDGVGLAAPQVGVLRRALVVDVERIAPDGERVRHLGLKQMVDPDILERRDPIEWEEGCLSIPEFRQTMRRSRWIRVRFLDRDGKEQQLEASDLLAVAIQHEIDHLDGKLIIDAASRLKREVYERKRKKGKIATGRISF